MASFFNLIGTLVKTGAVVAGLGVAAVTGFAIATKPDKEMLKKDIEQSINSESDNAVEHTAKKVAAKVAVGTADIVVKDYLVAQTANVTFVDGTKQTYVGAFQNWKPIPTPTQN